MWPQHRGDYKYLSWFAAPESEVMRIVIVIYLLYSHYPLPDVFVRLLWLRLQLQQRCFAACWHNVLMCVMMCVLRAAETCHVCHVSNCTQMYRLRLYYWFSHYPYDNRCALLGIDRLEFRWLRADLILYYKIINGLVSLSPDSFFNFNTSHITRGHSLKLHVSTSRINCRQHFFRCSSSQSMEFVAGRGYFCASVICVYFSFEKCEPQQILSW